MFEEHDSQYVKGALQAMMFVTDEPVTVLTFAGMIGVSAEAVQQALIELQQDYQNSDSGIQLYEVAGGWRLATHPKYHELIESYVVSWDKRKLSQAALEALAIIAYCQPITRNAISSVRGVNTDSSVNSLLEKGYVREAGFQDAPGYPVLYATSKAFLERFGLRSIADLPDLESFAPDEETQALIFDRLNIVRDEQQPVLVNGELFGDEETDGMSAIDARTGQMSVSFDKLSDAVDEIAGEQVEPAQNAASLSEAMQKMLDDALASSIGVVDKINFDELVFDEDE